MVGVVVGVDVGGVGVVGHGVVVGVLDDVVDVGAVVVGHGPVVGGVLLDVGLLDELVLAALLAVELLDGVVVAVVLLPAVLAVDDLDCGLDERGSAVALPLLPVDDNGEA